MDSLTTTQKLLEEAKTNCTKLKDQLCDNEDLYLQREEDLHQFYRTELEKQKSFHAECRASAHQRFTAFETQLREEDMEISAKDQELCAAETRALELNERFRALEMSEQELWDKLKSTRNSYATHLKVAIKREKQWQEFRKLYARGVKSIRASNNRERKLCEKLNLARHEISVSRTPDESMDRSSGTCSPGTSSASQLPRVESAGDIVGCLLKMRQQKISKLIKENKKLKRRAEERAVLTGRVSKLESCQKMLKRQLEIRWNKER